MKWKSDAEAFALGPRDKLVKVRFPFGGHQLEHKLLGPISKAVPVAVVRGRYWKRLLCRLGNHDYDVRAVAETKEEALREMLRSLAA